MLRFNSVLQIDESGRTREVREPNAVDTIHNIPEAHTAFGRDIIYYIAMFSNTRRRQCLVYSLFNHQTAFNYDSRNSDGKSRR